MTTNLLLNLITIALYILTWVFIVRSVKECIDSPESEPSLNKTYLITWAIALTTHLLSISTSLSIDKELSFSFVALSFYVMCFISLILFISTLRRRIQSLAIVILPFTILSIILIMLRSESSNYIPVNSGLSLHILVSLLAYSTLMLAAIQALLLATQNNSLHQRLKNPKKSNFIRTLPSLEDMEYLLFSLIAIGVFLLSISLLSGFYFLDNLFGSSVAHKTILSILSFIIFSALLLGRWKYGWRGKTAVRWTISGFVVLALAFFGSKFIQEYIVSNSTDQAMSSNDGRHNNKIQNTPPHFLHKSDVKNHVKNHSKSYVQL